MMLGQDRDSWIRKNLESVLPETKNIRGEGDAERKQKAMKEGRENWGKREKKIKRRSRERKKKTWGGDANVWGKNKGNARPSAYAEDGLGTEGAVSDFCAPQEETNGRLWGGGWGASTKPLGILNPRRNTLAKVKCSSKHEWQQPRGYKGPDGMFDKAMGGQAAEEAPVPSSLHSPNLWSACMTHTAASRSKEQTVLNWVTSLSAFG